MRAKAYTVEHSLPGGVFVADLKLTRSEAEDAVAELVEREPDEGWTTREIDVEIPVAES